MFPKEEFVQYIYITPSFLGYHVPTLVEMITRCLGWKVHLILQLAAVSALCFGYFFCFYMIIEKDFF